MSLESNPFPLARKKFHGNAQKRMDRNCESIGKPSISSRRSTGTGKFPGFWDIFPIRCPEAERRSENGVSVRPLRRKF